jgi:chromosome segregation protein
VLIGKSGKFNKSKHTMAGGSVGLFEGKRIGRAKNLDNLLKEIKQAETRIQNYKNKSEELQSKLSALKASGRTNELRQQQFELNQVNTELVTVKTKQEQYQAFIENSLNRKQDIANKVAGIKEEILNLGPLLIELKAQKQSKVI